MSDADDDDQAGIARRDMFRGGAALAMGAAIAGCGKREEPHPAPARPVQPESAQPPPAATAKPPVHDEAPATDLIEATFADLQERMKSGKETAKSLVAKYRQRIEAVDQKGPTLRSVLELNPEADAIADKLDAERAAGKLRGPLHGIPILVKDNIDTGDKMTTT